MKLNKEELSKLITILLYTLEKEGRGDHFSEAGWQIACLVQKYLDDEIKLYLKEVIGEDNVVKYEGDKNPKGFYPEVELMNKAINIEKAAQRKRGGL